MSSNNMFVVGAGLIGILGAVGAFLVEHIRQEKRRQMMAQDLVRIDRQLSTLRNELEELRSIQKQRQRQPSQSKKSMSTLSYSQTRSTRSITADEYRTASDIDSSDMEYYDLTDEEVAEHAPYQKLIKDADTKLSNGDLEQIFEITTVLENLCSTYPDRPELMYRLGKCYYHIAMQSATPLKKREYIGKGIELCSNALDLDEDDAEIHKWYAILIGMRSDFQPTKERISDGYVFKQHIEIAINLNPTDASLHHMMGRFKYEIAGLKWFERKVASALFGEPPRATYEEALAYFMDAERLSKKEWKENKMFIGKCEIAVGNVREGLDWLLKANEITECTAEENTLNAEIGRLLEKYNSHR